MHVGARHCWKCMISLSVDTKISYFLRLDTFICLPTEYLLKLKKKHLKKEQGVEHGEHGDYFQIFRKHSTVVRRRGVCFKPEEICLTGNIETTC